MFAAIPFLPMPVPIRFRASLFPRARIEIPDAWACQLDRSLALSAVGRWRVPKVVFESAVPFPSSDAPGEDYSDDSDRF